MDYGYGGGGGFSTTSYGAQGGANDGGFVTGGSQEHTGGSRNYGEDTIRPVTIKQIVDAEHNPHTDKWTIDGSDVTQVTFVAQIRSITTHTINSVYKFEDGTASIEVKQWIDPEFLERTEGEDAPKDPSLRKPVEQDYARVFGSLKDLNGKRFVPARPGAIRAVNDYNEVHYHLLEATVVHLFFTRGKPPQPGMANKASATGMQQQNQQTQQGYDVTMGGTATMTFPIGTSQAARKVWNFLANSPQTNEGHHLHLIASQLKMDIGVVSRAGQELQDNGLLYTTVNEETWAALGND